MKPIKYVLLISIMIGSLSSCHDLDVPIVTKLTPGTFPVTQQQFIQAAGPTYSSFRQNYALEYWFMQTLSTDEAIMPARGGNWYDNARYEQHLTCPGQNS